jgi:hypothetical protein
MLGVERLMGRFKSLLIKNLGKISSTFVSATFAAWTHFQICTDAFAKLITACRLWFRTMLLCRKL